MPLHRPLLLALLISLFTASANFGFSQQHAPKSVAELAAASTTELSDQARARYEFGHKQLRDGDLTSALETFTQVIDEHPDFAAAYLSRAQVYRRLESEAANVEERDRAALGYINDERRVAKELNRRLLANDFKNLFTVSTVALLAIYFTFWLMIVYLFWQNGEQLPLGLALFFVTSVLMLAVPDGPLRYTLFVAGITTHVVTAYSKLRGKQSRLQANDNSPLAASLREIKEKIPLPDPAAFEPETKACPNCSREVSRSARVCPRCEHRF